MWIGVLWAGLRVAMWITHVGGKFRHGLLEKSLKKITNFMRNSLKRSFFSEILRVRNPSRIAKVTLRELFSEKSSARG